MIWILQKPRFRNTVRTMKIIELEEVDSTNEYCKRLDTEEDIIVIAKHQAAGRGTKGRSFISDCGGLYLSVIRHYKDFSAENTFKIMVNACVAVCRTIESFALTPKIRWANDVLVSGKKISGTLIENSFRGNCLRSIVGIGINVNNKIPEELEDIATNVSFHTPAEITVEEVKRKLIKNLQTDYTIAEYKNYIGFFGKKVKLITIDGERIVTACDVSADGRLVVEEADGMISYISSAEVSLRL